MLGLLALTLAAPQVQIGNTKLVGLDITGFKLDFFFGGMIFYSVVRGSMFFYSDSICEASPR